MKDSGEKTSLGSIARLFFKLGCIGFGGPAAHIAMMEREVVRKRRWLSEALFLDLVGATNLIPGPNSTEMAMHCGHEKAGWKGLVVAGICFILPAVVITGFIAWLYQRYGKLPVVEPFIYGIKPAIIALVVSLMFSLGRKALKSVELAVFGVLAALLAFSGIHEIYILFGLGFAGVFLHLIKNRRRTVASVFPLLFFQSSMVSLEIFNWKLFWIFLKIGSILYGSGYVLFAFLDAELVSTGMLSKTELIDAIAVGQITPGPVFSSATFIGFQIASLPGALAATLGIFLPSFLFVALLNPLMPALRKSATMSVFLDTVNIVSVGLILAVCVDMARTSVTDWRSGLIAILALIVALKFEKLNSVFVVLGGALMGYLLWCL